MAVTRTAFIEDIQKIFVYLFRDVLTDQSWTHWKVRFEWPDEKVLQEHNNIIHIEPPKISDYIRCQGGIHSFKLDLRYGLWTNRTYGGNEEMNMIGSYFVDFFLNGQKWSVQSFNVTLGDNAYNAQTLLNHAIDVLEVKPTAPIPFFELDPDVFREEYILDIQY